MIINTSILAGEGFEYEKEAHITIEDGLIREAECGFEKGGVDFSNYLAVPSFFNAHTHLGDSFAMDAAAGLNVRQAVGSKGLKWKLYEGSTGRKRINSMKESLAYMVSSGTTGFSDFREYGINGINELKTALKSSPLKPVILGRDVDEGECDGLGLNVYQVGQIPKKRRKLLALHAGECKGEIEKAFGYNPDIIVHFTKATSSEIKKAVSEKIDVVVCPRSNSLLRAGFPPIRGMLDSGINVSLGTDNVMVSQPDMFREMEYTYTASMLNESPIAPEEVLMMATRNGAQAFKINSGLIKKGMNADIIFLDKKYSCLAHSRNILASIVHRCGLQDVRKVMIDGRMVFVR
jgi:cytosine/adenosine deaminase-related metal-dependent hydrolase